MSEETTAKRTCKWEGCNTDISGTHYKTLYCTVHKAAAVTKTQHDYRSRTTGEKKPKKSASPCKKCQRENCDDRGRPEDHCARFTLRTEKVEPAAVKSDPEPDPPADPRLAPEDYRPPIETPAAKKPAKKKASKKRAPAKKKAHHKPGLVPGSVKPPAQKSLPMYRVGIQDLLDIVPAVRSFETDEEARAYFEGFFMGRAVERITGGRIAA